MRKRKLSLMPVIGWGLMLAFAAYVWVFALVSVMAAG